MTATADSLVKKLAGHPLEDGLLGDYASAAEFILEDEARREAFFNKCFDMVTNWLGGPVDRFAEAKLLSEAKAIARWVETECNEDDERRRAWRPD